jgi:cell division protein FtsW (lipid II flippase)
VALRRMIGQADRPLMVVLGLIVLLGLYNLSSASQPLGGRLHVSHGLHVAVGLAVMFGVASLHYRNLEGLAYPIFGVVVAMLLATDAFGKLVNGSRRWLVLGPVNIQTSDLAKVAVVLVVAKAFHMVRWEGGLTLREIFRPLNISRPLVVVAAVLALSVFGEGLQPAKLKAKHGRKYRTVQTLGPKHEDVMLGRGEGEARVRLEGAGVARDHAQVVRTGEGAYLLRDVGSTAGTFVNGAQVTGDVALKDGDLIRLGLSPRSELMFSASIQKLRGALPWMALVGAVWLLLAVVLQLRRGRWEAQDLVAPIDVVALPCVLILIQPDLGTTLVVLLIAFSMILYVGLRPASLVLLITGTLVFGTLSWFTVLKPYQKERVTTFLNPTSDLAGAGYHQHQSLIAVGSGQLWGKGHGQGTQTQLSFLPEQQTDFIFSVWAEEQGFVGSASLVVLFALFILLALRVAARARDRFGALLAVGATAMIFWHTIINMLMVLRLAPVVGVPLPLWSNGGSFALTTLIGVGLLLNVSAHRNLF